MQIKMFGYGKFIIGAAFTVGLTVSIPASAQEVCPDGSTEVVIDTGNEFISTCVSEEIVEGAEAGEPVTLSYVGCPCNYADFFDPKRARNYDASDRPLCRETSSGLRLDGLKKKPDKGGATRFEFRSGRASGGQPCLVTLFRSGKNLVFQSLAVDAAEEAKCRININAYRAAVPNDEYAALVCPGF